MKLINKFSVHICVELSLDEYIGIYKMIGNTSTTSRKRDFNLSEEQAISLSMTYEDMKKILKNNGIKEDE